MKIRLLKYNMVNHRISTLDGDYSCWLVHPKSIKRFSPATIASVHQNRPSKSKIIFHM